MIDWSKTTKAEHTLLGDIAKRALDEGLILKEYYADRLMDYQACHATCPMDLEKLLASDRYNFAHDVGGITLHIDRTTGELGGCFVPRCSLPTPTPTLSNGDYTLEVCEQCIGLRHVPTDYYMTMSHLEQYGTVEDDDDNVLFEIPKHIVEWALEFEANHDFGDDRDS